MRVNFYDVKKAVKNILPSVRPVDLIKLRPDVKNKLCSSTWSIPVVVKKSETYMNIVLIKFPEASLFELCYRYKNSIILYVKRRIEGTVFGIFFRPVVFVSAWIDLLDKFPRTPPGDPVLKPNRFLFCFIFVNLVLSFPVTLPRHQILKHV